MASKGIDCFTYLSTSQFQTVVASRGNSDINFTEGGKMQMEHCEIEKSSLNGPGGIFENTGRLRIDAYSNNSELLSRYAEINPVTGNIADSNMKNMLETTSEIGDNYAVSYGFYDAGAGKSHQVYVYVTDNYSNWMGDLINATPQLKEQPFGTFVLPGSHDAGSFTAFLNDEIIQSIFNALGAELPEMSMAKRAIVNLFYTQKDDINTQLKLGIRYFDFRPGYTINRLVDNELRHQHNFLPGYRFDSFLSDVVGFLEAHQNEVVVVNIKYDGFAQDDMKPSDEVVKEYISNAIVNSNIQIGTREDLNLTTSTILEQNKRLIVLQRTNNCRDSYNDSYKTDDPNKIIESMNSILAETEGDWTVLQLQGTFSGVFWGGITSGILTLSDASSPLLSTKAKFDYATYDWIGQKDNVASKCGKNLLVLLNDFVDNALVSYAISITKQRSTLNS